MRIDSLEKTKRDPYVDGQYVHVAGCEAKQQRAGDGAHAENQGLDGMRVFGCEAERGGVFMMEFVDVLVEYAGVESLMSCRTVGLRIRTKGEFWVRWG
jgi:hypothetical protein